ncbi:hypothetical protein, partial [Mesorhizobium sp. M7A.F.Ca.CA.002.05.1.1]|uniref:hypothetical protein n=1 Tax=Mesorhizobium sp. M7A.F.Ca.CA.002.05.1.1 TaxID=2496704 RepID=UPI0019D1EFD3
EIRLRQVKRFGIVDRFSCIGHWSAICIARRAYKLGRELSCYGKSARGRAETPGGSGGAQATRNTGPVIRIAIAKRREKLVMAGLLAEATAGIKRLVRFTYIVKSKR